MSLAIMGCGSIVLDKYNSHNHVALVSLREALQKVKAPLEGNTFAATVKLNYIVGSSICVETNPEDKIIFAQRPRHNGKTRFVLNRSPKTTTEVSFVLSKITKHEWVIQTAYYGTLHPPEPFDPNRNDDSIGFWKSHALIWGYTEVIAGTVQEDCPW